jgi:hypothetical protein
MWTYALFSVYTLALLLVIDDLPVSMLSRVSKNLVGATFSAYYNSLYSFRGIKSLNDCVGIMDSDLFSLNEMLTDFCDI